MAGRDRTRRERAKLAVQAPNADDLLPLPRGVTGFAQPGDPALSFIPRHEARRVVASMFSHAITFDPAEELPIARSFHDVRATIRRGRETERVRVLVNCFVPWITFAEAHHCRMDLEFAPMPLGATPPPEPFVVVPISLLERAIEPAMCVRLGPREPTMTWLGHCVGDLVFNFED